MVEVVLVEVLVDVLVDVEVDGDVDVDVDGEVVVVDDAIVLVTGSPATVVVVSIGAVDETTTVDVVVDDGAVVLVVVGVGVVVVVVDDVVELDVVDVDVEVDVVDEVVVVVDPGTSPGAAVNRSSCVWTDWTIGTGSEPSHEPSSVEYRLRKSTDTRMLSLSSRSLSDGVAPWTPPRTLSPTTNEEDEDP